MKTVLNTFNEGVTRSNLPIYESYVIELLSHTSSLRIITGTPTGGATATARLIGNGYFTDSGNTVNLGKQIVFSTSGSIYIFANDNVQVSIFSTKDIKTINLSLVSDYVVGNQNTKNFKEITTLETLIVSENTVGDILELSNLTNLTALYLNKSKVTGLFANLGYLTSLTTLDVDGTSNINGSMEDFVAKQIESGRATGSLNLDTPNVVGSITFEGVKLNDRGVLSWTDINNITYTPD